MSLDRRTWLGLCGLGVAGSQLAAAEQHAIVARHAADLKIVKLTVTPIALPDPPLLAASGCHGPYFLRNVVELATEGGIVGVGETHGGAGVTADLERARRIVIGRNAFAYRQFARELQALGMSAYAAIE